MAEKQLGPLKAPAKSPSRQALDRTKFTSGRRRVSRTAGTPYGTAALNAALEDFAEVTERSHGLFRISASMGNLIASGQLNERYVTAALLDVARDRGMDLRKAERTMQRGIDRGRATPRSPRRAAIYNRNDATVALVEWCEAVGRGEWTERSSGTDLRVLAGFGLIAKKVGKLRFSASHRQIAEEAGVSVSSVRCALRRGLHGYVFRVNYGNRVQGTASKWQLVTKQARTNDHSLSLGEEQRLVAGARALDLPDHAQWDRWPNGWRVYNLLQSDEGMTVSVISEITGRPPGSVRRILNVLRDRQLARREESGEWTALLPVEDGVDGTRTRRARERRHRDERKLWANSRSVLIEQNRHRSRDQRAAR